MKTKNSTSWDSQLNWLDRKEDDYNPETAEHIDVKSEVQYFCIFCGVKIISDYTDFQCMSCGWSPIENNNDKDQPRSKEELSYSCPRCNELIFEEDNFECNKCHWFPSLQHGTSDDYMVKVESSTDDDNSSNSQYFCIFCGVKIVSDYTDFQCMSCGWSPIGNNNDKDQPRSKGEHSYSCPRCNELIFEEDNFECNKCHWFPSIEIESSNSLLNFEITGKKSLSDLLLSNFEWHELTHYASVAKQLNLLNSWERSFLFNIGKKLQWKTWGYDTEISESQKRCFATVFLDFILRFPTDHRCNNYPCEKCNKIIAFRNAIRHYDKKLIHNFASQSTISRNVLRSLTKKNEERNWELTIPLYDWQKRCVSQWMKDKKGIAKVVTGAGKTHVALEAISRITNKGKKEGVRVFIVVPTVILLEQWLHALRDKLHVSLEDIGLFYSEEWGDFERDLIQIYVINSARDILAQYNEQLRRKNIRTFLIADECHRYGSEVNSKIFQSKYNWTLGLSATPERDADDNLNEILIPNLGEIFFEYSYADALEDGIIPNFSLIMCLIELKKHEIEKYERYSTTITRLQRKLEKLYPQLRYMRSNYIRQLNAIHKQEENEDKREIIENLRRMFVVRKMIIHDAENRYNAVLTLIERIYEEIPKPRIIIFHEKINFSENIYKILKHCEYDVEIYHSELPKNQRTESMNRYRKGKSNILITCKALDEGWDVPNTNVGIIAASTQSIRQHIQRMGRILRKTKEKDHAYIYTVYIQGKEDRILSKNEMRKIHGIADRKILDLRHQEQRVIVISNSIESQDSVHDKGSFLCSNCGNSIAKGDVHCSNCEMLIAWSISDDYRKTYVANKEIHDGNDILVI